MNKFTKFKKKLAYKFDNTLTKGISSMIWWLAIVAVIIVLTITIIVWSFDLSSNKSFFDQFWYFMLKTIGDDATLKTTWFYRIFYLLIVFTSIFITSILISILTQMIQNRIQELRKGHSEIFEKNHLVILGWSSKIYTILQELDQSAFDEKKKQSIVILGNQDKIFMEDEIARNTKKLKAINVICRSGNPADKAFLKILNIKDVKSIIILAENRNNPDTEIIKTLLALKGHVANSAEYNEISRKTISEIHDADNELIAKIITKKQSKLIKIKEFTSKIIAQTSRQSGLPKVYEELLNYKDTEIYFIKNNLKSEINYKDILLKYENISIIGYVEKVNGVDKYHLNPPNDTIMNNKNNLIVIAKSKLEAKNPKEYSYENTTKYEKHKINDNNIEPQNILILGWNDMGEQIIKELRSYVNDKSKQEIMIVPEIGHDKFDKYVLKKERADNFTIQFDLKRDYFNYNYLNETLKSKLFKNIIILSDHNLETQESDVKNITILHFIRDIEEKINENLSNDKISIDVVCQLLDKKNQELIDDFHKNDFVVSAKLASLFLTQISQEPRLLSVFNEIFDEDGSEIYLKNVENYIKIGETVTYADIVRVVSLKNKTVIGYEFHKNKLTVLNIQKNENITIQEGDRIILLEETKF